MKLLKNITAFVLACSMCCITAYADVSENPQASKPVTEYYADDLLSNFEDESIQTSVSTTTLESLPAKSMILMEQNTGNVLFESHADEQLAPASITKIMSLLLFCEAISEGKLKLSDKVTCSEHAASMGGSQIWFEPSEAMTVNDLMKAVAVGSANDATVALGEAVAGSEDAFVDLMNSRAKELGMKNTHFVNCSGLDADGHLTTARDIAIMSRELMKHSLITDYSTIWMDTLRNGSTQLVNTNKLVRFYKGATGLKTGTTDQAGCCLSATAKRDSLELIAVVMGSPSSNDRFSSAKALLNFGFANYSTKKVPIDISENETIKINGGTKTSIKLSAPKKVNVLCEKSNAEQIKVKLNLPESVDAPIKKGDVIGRAEILLNDKPITSVNIKATEDVEVMTFYKALLRVLLGIFDN